MTTEKQIEANRQNAGKSTGPQTAQGKAKAARNSLRHGLCCQSSDIIFGRETNRQYNSFYRALFDDLAPVGPKETILADRIIILSWKLKRLARWETQTMSVLMEKVQNSNPIVIRYRDLISNKQPVPQNIADAITWFGNNALGEVALSNFASHGQDSGRALENIQVYESRIERSLYKAQLEFQKLQFIRRQNEAKNETNPNSVGQASPLESNPNHSTSVGQASPLESNPNHSTSVGQASLLDIGKNQTNPNCS